LNQDGQLKLEVMQSLLEPCDRVTYGQRLKQAAEKSITFEGIMLTVGQSSQVMSISGGDSRRPQSIGCDY
jgi:hypothetical protein